MPCNDQPSASTAASPAVGRRAAADRDEHPPEALAARGRDQLAGAARARAQRIVPSRHQREAARARHLDDRDARRQHTPFRVDALAERTGDGRDAPRATLGAQQRVERALAPVGERDLHHVFETGTPQTGRDRGGGLVGPQRAPELVGAGNGPSRGRETVRGWAHVA